MEKREINNLARLAIKEVEWVGLVYRLVKVLRINIFIVDATGTIIVPPIHNKYGGRILTDPRLKFDLQIGSHEYFDSFEPSSGRFVEFCGKYDLRMYAAPIFRGPSRKPIVYLVLGPVLLNRRRESHEYERMARSENVESGIILDELNEIRVVSNLMIKAIQELLSEIIDSKAGANLSEDIKDLEKELKIETQVSKEIEHNQKGTSPNDKLLKMLEQFLETALKMTDTECGSILLLDENSEVLAMKVSRGLDEEKIKDIKIKVGEGIAGLAFQKDESFLISEKNSDNRISHLLKRPEIKQALVMPLHVRDKVLGVLNLHTKKETSDINSQIHNLQFLSNLLSSAL